MMRFGSNQYDSSFVKENMMGPNSIRMIEELAKSLKLEKDMRVLDLGCGKGLTSIFLAKEFGVTVLCHRPMDQRVGELRAVQGDGRGR